MKDGIFPADLKKKVVKPLVQGFLSARSLVYYMEGLPLTLEQNLFGRQGDHAPPLQLQDETINYALELLEADADRFARGVYPIEVLTPQTPWNHFRSWTRVMGDGFWLAWRKRQKLNKQFGQKAQQWLKDLPEYYRRNFHFQTDGYLSEHSASIYDHQVEILFRGAAGAMRRIMIEPLQQRLPESGQGVKALEIGCGTGSATQYMAASFPQMNITCMDLSRPYLKAAQERLKKYPRVDFLQGAGENLNFNDASYDLVYSVFLFHELPREVREQILAESLRVLKPGGYLVLLDSIQLGDVDNLNWALTDFPKNFHEPFYKNYIENPMWPMMERLGFKDAHTEMGFLSKAIIAQKPERSPVTAVS